MPTPDRCARCDYGDEIAALKERAERAEGERNQSVGDLKAEVVANRIAREELEAARDEDQDAFRVVMADRDDWRALHAQAVANNQQTIDGLLERVRVAELCGSEADDAASYERNKYERRLLAACQSLHRKWRGAYRTARDYGEALENVCDSLGMKETHWMVIGSDVAAVVVERDSLRVEVERLKVECQARTADRDRVVDEWAKWLASPAVAAEAPRQAARIEALEGALRQMAAGPDAEALAQADSDSEVANIWRRFGIRCWNDARALLPASPSASCCHSPEPAKCAACEEEFKERRASLPAPRKESCPACGRELEPGTGCACDWPLKTDALADGGTVGEGFCCVHARMPCTFGLDCCTGVCSVFGASGSCAESQIGGRCATDLDCFQARCHYGFCREFPDAG